MKMIKTLPAILLLSGIILSSCSAQSKLKGFQKIVYHSSFCFGTCPRIDMNIDASRNIYVERQFFRGKGKEDTAGSGRFRGVLDKTTFNELMNMLVKSNYAEQKWPEVTCCDGVITTILIFDKKKRTYLKSMTPPDEARELIDLLKKIALETELQPAAEKMELEQ